MPVIITEPNPGPAQPPGGGLPPPLPDAPIQTGIIGGGKNSIIGTNGDCEEVGIGVGGDPIYACEGDLPAI